MKSKYWISGFFVDKQSSDDEDPSGKARSRHIAVNKADLANSIEVLESFKLARESWELLCSLESLDKGKPNYRQCYTFYYCCFSIVEAQFQQVEAFEIWLNLHPCCFFYLGSVRSCSQLLLFWMLCFLASVSFLVSLLVHWLLLEEASTEGTVD